MNNTEKQSAKKLAQETLKFYGWEDESADEVLLNVIVEIINKWVNKN